MLGSFAWFRLCRVRGAGTVVLNAANTYGGDTVLEEGVLKLGAADALPATSTFVGLPEGWAPVNAGGTLKVREPIGVMVIVK